MKYALLGDIHGYDLAKLEPVLRSENVDVLICIGDFDQITTIRQFIELEKKYLDAGKQVIKVPANHDCAIFHGQAIYDKYPKLLKLGGKTSLELHKELESDKIAHAYMNNLLNSKGIGGTSHKARTFLDEPRFGKNYQTIIMHGAYAGDLSSFPNCPEELKDMATRLKTRDDYEKNFAIMAEKGDKIMIKGHDHNSSYAYKDPKEGLSIIAPKKGEGKYYKLFNYRLHTINPGALNSGVFAIIDTKFQNEEVPILRYVWIGF